MLGQAAEIYVACFVKDIFDWADGETLDGVVTEPVTLGAAIGFGESGRGCQDAKMLYKETRMPKKAKTRQSARVVASRNNRQEGDLRCSTT